MDILERRNVYATFFLIGSHVEKYPDLVNLILLGLSKQYLNDVVLVTHSLLTIVLLGFFLWPRCLGSEIGVLPGSGFKVCGGFK